MAEQKILSGKAAIVSGGSSGMGLASARLLAQDGAAVLIMGRRPEKLQEGLEGLREEAPGARIEAFCGDAGNAAQVQSALAEACSMLGHLDIIVSAVGGGAYKPLLLVEEEEMLKEYRTTVLTAFFMIKYGAPKLRTGGAIVCVSSTAGGFPCAGLGPYAAAKAGLEMLVKVAADELGKAQIRVNAVRPGFTRAEGTASMFADAELVETFNKIIPMGRAGESDDLARAIRFLAGPESGWVTGQIFAADGGQELRGFPSPYPMLEMIYGKPVMDQVLAGKMPD